MFVLYENVALEINRLLLFVFFLEWYTGVTLVAYPSGVYFYLNPEICKIWQRRLLFWNYRQHFFQFKFAIWRNNWSVTVGEAPETTVVVPFHLKTFFHCRCFGIWKKIKTVFSPNLTVFNKKKWTTYQATSSVRTKSRTRYRSPPAR